MTVDPGEVAVREMHKIGVGVQPDEAYHRASRRLADEHEIVALLLLARRRARRPALGTMPSIRLCRRSYDLASVERGSSRGPNARRDTQKSWPYSAFIEWSLIGLVVSSQASWRERTVSRMTIAKPSRLWDHHRLGRVVCKKWMIHVTAEACYKSAMFSV